MTPVLAAGVAALVAAAPGPTGSPLPPLPAKIGTGGIGFLITMVLIVAAVGLFFALRGSMRRLRAAEQSGTFGAGTPPRGSGSRRREPRGRPEGPGGS